MPHINIPFCDPLELYAAAGRAFGNTRALLYSSSQEGRYGRYSYLGCDLAEVIIHYDKHKIARVLSSPQHMLFGYLGYENVRQTEPSIPIPKKHGLRFPEVCLMRFKRVYIFDHKHRTATLHTDENIPSIKLQPQTPPSVRRRMPQPVTSHSHMSDTHYIRNVRKILEHINAGDLFQANITRKFSFTYTQSPDPAVVFARLTQTSPSAFSALLDTPFGAIISSSPEMFMTLTPDGIIRTAPIKGSAARISNPEQDAKVKSALKNSEKDRAENIMIADLYRNDMARSCIPGSVIAEQLCRLESFRTVHHLVSDIRGQLSPEISAVDAVMRAFPPGSMTGAPKPEAMKLCARYEHMQRGVYSGILGMFGGDRSANLSVVIRTILLQGKQAETQSGGGIVADSVPEKELLETRFKLRGVLTALGYQQRRPQRNRFF